jgi:hypothetical protein
MAPQTLEVERASIRRRVDKKLSELAGSLVSIPRAELTADRDF